jgi:hypothetical protein
MSALPPKADISESDRHVRFVPKADIDTRPYDGRFAPNSGHATWTLIRLLPVGPSAIIRGGEITIEFRRRVQLASARRARITDNARRLAPNKRKHEGHVLLNQRRCDCGLRHSQGC